MVNCQLPAIGAVPDELFELELLPPQPDNSKSDAHKQNSSAEFCANKNAERISLSLAEARVCFIRKPISGIRICAALKNST